MKNGNSPASPCANDANKPQGGFGVDLRNFTGLTKRELIAAMALQGLLSNPGGPVQASSMSGWTPVTNCTHGDVAKEAIEFADAMLAELERTA